jgi:hypothetical protein
MPVNKGAPFNSSSNNNLTTNNNNNNVNSREVLPLLRLRFFSFCKEKQQRATRNAQRDAQHAQRENTSNTHNA